MLNLGWKTIIRRVSMRVLPLHLALCTLIGGSAMIPQTSAIAEENEENMVRLSVGCGKATYPAGDSYPMSNSSKGYTVIVACKKGLIERVFIKGKPLPEAVEVCNPTPRCFAAPLNNGFVQGKFMWGETINFRISNVTLQ
jgi:hypothetical protein